MSVPQLLPLCDVLPVFKDEKKTEHHCIKLRNVGFKFDPNSTILLCDLEQVTEPL